MKTPKKLLITSAAAALGFSLAFAEGLRKDESENGAAQDQESAEIQESEQDSQEFGERPQHRTDAKQAGKLDAMKASELEGSRVENQQGDRLGTVDSLAVDLESGELAYIVVSAGGFLGIGDELKLVPPDAVDVQQEEGGLGESFTLRVDIDEQQWEQAPTIEDRTKLAELDEQRGREVYQHYGIEWEQRSAVEFGGREQKDAEFGSPDREVEIEVNEEEDIEIREEEEVDVPEEQPEFGTPPLREETEDPAEQESIEQPAEPGQRGMQQRQETEDQQVQEFGARQQRETGATEREQRVETGVEIEEREDPTLGRHEAEEHRQAEESAPQSIEFGARGKEMGELRASSDLRRASIQGAQQEEIGQIDDLLVDIENGQVTFVLITPDTDFWETADETYAVAPQALTLLGEDELMLNITQEQMEQAEVLTQANIQTHARQHAMQRDQQRDQPQVFRYQEEDDGGVFGRPDRDQQETSERDQQDTETPDIPREPGAAPGQQQEQQQDRY